MRAARFRSPCLLLRWSPQVGSIYLWEELNGWSDLRTHRRSLWYHLCHRCIYIYECSISRFWERDAAWHESVGYAYRCCGNFVEDTGLDSESNTNTMDPPLIIRVTPREKNIALTHLPQAILSWKSGLAEGCNADVVPLELMNHQCSPASWSCVIVVVKKCANIPCRNFEF